MSWEGTFPNLASIITSILTLVHSPFSQATLKSDEDSFVSLKDSLWSKQTVRSAEILSTPLNITCFFSVPKLIMLFFRSVCTGARLKAFFTLQRHHTNGEHLAFALSKLAPIGWIYSFLPIITGQERDEYIDATLEIPGQDNRTSWKRSYQVAHRSNPQIQRYIS